MIELDKIYNMDCLKGMEMIPDGSVDAAICDLPYGTTRNGWDSVIPMDALWAQYRRVCRPDAAIVLFSQQPFTSALVMSNPGMFRYEWIWQKELATGFLNANRAPLKEHENIMVFSKAQAVYHPRMKSGYKKYARSTGDRSTNYGKYIRTKTVSNGERFPTSVITFPRDRDGFHPTQKPVDLIRYLIRTYTEEGDVILDNCMGSGTTAVAAMKENRHFIGFELNEEYWRKACDRVQRERMQPELF